MIGLAHSYATLLAKTGVTSNAIAPALIETDMVSGNPNIKRDVIPVGRLGDVGEDEALIKKKQRLERLLQHALKWEDARSIERSLKLARSEAGVRGA